MIYKTKFGKYVDLDRIVAISDNQYGRFEIYFQLMENPMLIQIKLTGGCLYAQTNAHSEAYMKMLEKEHQQFAEGHQDLVDAWKRNAEAISSPKPD